MVTQIRDLGVLRQGQPYVCMFVARNPLNAHRISTSFSGTGCRRGVISRSGEILGLYGTNWVVGHHYSTLRTSWPITIGSPTFEEDGGRVVCTLILFSCAFSQTRRVASSVDCSLRVLSPLCWYSDNSICRQVHLLLVVLNFRCQAQTRVLFLGPALVTNATSRSSMDKTVHVQPTRHQSRLEDRWGYLSSQMLPTVCCKQPLRIGRLFYRMTERTAPSL